MAVILQGTSYSLSGTKYDVYLEADITATAEDMVVRRLEIDYKASDDQLDSPILASTLTLSLSVPDGTQETLLTALATAQETDYRIRVMRDSSLYWVGFVLLDLVEIQDRPFPYDFQLKATDGIGRLKGLDYNDAGTAYTGHDTLQAHLQNVLGKIGLQDSYTAGDPFLIVHSTIWEENQTPNDATNPLTKTRFQHKALRSVDRRGNLEYMNCREVLEELCRICGARFFYSDGSYHFMEVFDYARSAEVIQLQRYDKDFAAISTLNVGDWTTYTETAGNSTQYAAGSVDTIARTGGRQTLYPPLKEVEYTYKHYSTQNLVPGAVWKETNFVAVTVEDVDDNGGTTRLSFQSALQARIEYNNSTVFQFSKILFRIQFKILNTEGADYTLDRPATIAANGVVSYGTAQWRQGTYYYEFVASGYSVVPDMVINQTVGFITPSLPISGDLEVQLFAEAVYAGGTVVSALDYDLFFTFSDNYLEALIDGSLDGQYNYTISKAENSNGSANSATIERETLIGDGPTGNAYGHLQYQDDTDIWRVASSWRRYASGAALSGNESRNDLLASEVLSMQSRPSRRMDITIIAPTYQAHFRLQRLSYTMIFQQGRFLLDRDEWSGTWVAVARYTNDVTVQAQQETTIAPDDPDIFGPPPPPPPSPPPPTIPAGDITVAPGDPDVALGINTTFTGVETPLTSGSTINALDLLDDHLTIPLYAGDVVVVTNPDTGETQNFTVDSDYALGTANRWTNNSSLNWVDNNGNTYIDNTTYDDLSVVSTTLTADIPEDSYLQYDSQFLIQLIDELRQDFALFDVVPHTDALTLGIKGFWRPGVRVGYRLKGVHFRVYANGSAQTWAASLRLDAGAGKVDVATFSGTGTGGDVVLPDASVQDGIYTFEVTTAAAGVTGLQITLIMLRVP